MGKDGRNVIQLGDRLVRVASEEAIERATDAEEAAERERTLEDYDEGNLRHRARAINGALNAFDFVPITGREYWQVYGHARDVFLPWALKAQAAINDIVAAAQRLDDE